MDPAVQLLLVIAVSFAVAAAVKRYRTAQRAAAVQAAAEDAGWTFESGPMSPVDLHIGHFPVFNRGRKARASNVVRTTLGPVEITAFDYRYTTGRREQTRVTRQTTVHVRSSGLRLPQFVLTPKGVLHKVGELIGYAASDVTFENSPDFSSRYVLRSNEAPYLVRNLFTVSVLSYFDQHSGLTVEAEGNGLLVYRYDRLVGAEELRAHMDEAFAVAHIFEERR